MSTTATPAPPTQVKSFADRLRSEISQRYSKQSEAAKELEISSSLLTKYLNNKLTPKAEKLSQISQKLGVTMAWLLTGEGPKEPQTSPPSFPQRFRLYREGQGLTQKQCSELFGVGPNYISKIEAGKANPSGVIQTLLELYEYRAESQVSDNPQTANKSNQATTFYYQENGFYHDLLRESHTLADPEASPLWQSLPRHRQVDICELARRMHLALKEHLRTH